MDKKKKDITTVILMWMGIGLVFGVILNLTLMDNKFVKDFLVGGVFHIGGKIFIKSLKMLVVPLVTFSLICGVLGIGDIRTLGRVGIKTLIFYLATTGFAITIGILLAIGIGPGKNFNLTTDVTFTVKEAPPFSEVIINLVPSNPIAAYANGEMLQIIFFTILFAMCLIMIGKRGKLIGDFSSTMNEIIMKIVDVVMLIAPIGVFCLMAKTFAEQGYGLIIPMAKYFFVVLGALFIHFIFTMSCIVRFFANLNPLVFFRKMRAAQITAFSTSSSNATIPTTIRCVEQKIGVDNSIASFTIPFGATINMDGTAIMQGVATIFIANVYGIELGIVQYLTVIGMAILASIGTAGVPGVGLIMLAMVFDQVGLPVAGIGLILGVDRLLDMSRTVVNITGDAAVTCAVAKSEGKLDKSVFNSQEVG